MERIISLLIGYFFGCFQTGFIIGRLKGKIDIREYGSGNSGTTNAIRVLGWKLGLFTFMGDFFKAVIVVVLSNYLFDNPIFGFYAGLGVVLGHNWPVFLKFKGGKGIAATAGLIVAVDYRIGLISIALFLVIVGLSKFVSLASIIMSISIPILLGLFYGMNSEHVFLGSLLMILAIYRHRANIKRLIAGNENKLGHKKNLQRNG